MEMRFRGIERTGGDNIVSSPPALYSGSVIFLLFRFYFGFPLGGFIPLLIPILVDLEDRTGLRVDIILIL